MAKQYTDPVNHTLTEADVASKDYSNFLDELTDVPSSVALRPFSIDKAGIAEQHAYVQIKSLFHEGEYSSVLCNITMQVELSGHRGIHMSRCEEALFALVEEKHESLDSFAVKLSESILVLQDSSTCYVEITGSYIHKRNTIKSGKVSRDRMTLFASAVSSKDVPTATQIGIAAFNMTGCPCTETFTKFAVVPQLKDAGFDLEQIKTILGITNSGTHTQRGLATLKVDKNDSGITYEEIYSILDKACHLVFELLKRPDEHELVVRVLRNPQFTEDVARDMVGVAIEKIGSKLSEESRVYVSSQLYDSIHIHDVYTEISKTYGELLSELK